DPIRFHRSKLRRQRSLACVAQPHHQHAGEGERKGRAKQTAAARRSRKNKINPDAPLEPLTTNGGARPDGPWRPSSWFRRSNAMNLHHLIGFSAVTALALAMPGSALGQQKSLKDQLVGTSTLTNWEQPRPDGSK